MGFWIIVILLSVMIGASIAVVLWQRGREFGPGAAHDMQIYRDQLSELERDVTRGVIGKDEAERARAEIGRRVLEADRNLTAGEATSGTAPRAAGIALLVLSLVGAGALYFVIGAPGYPDLPIDTRIALVEESRATRPSQAEAEAQLPVEIREDPDAERAALVARLRTEMERRPDQIEGLALLANEEARLGNFRAARLAQQRLIDALGAEAGAREYLELAEMSFMSAGGYISPETERALEEVILRDPGNGGARYYAGLMFASQGRPDRAYEIWRALLADSGPGDPWLAPIRAQIEQVAFDAGDVISVDDLPQPPPGPSPEEMAAADAMSEADRMAMIEGMVSGLADRLATDGGSATEWARLIGSLIVLERYDEARNIYAEAQQVFAGDDSALALMDQAATGLEAAE